MFLQGRDREVNKFDIITYIRQETGCGMMLIAKSLDELINKLKNPPLPVMDVGIRLNMEWEEYDMRKIN